MFFKFYILSTIYFSLAQGIAESTRTTTHFNTEHMLSTLRILTIESFTCIRELLQPCNYQLSKSIVHEIGWYSCLVNINNLPFCDMYFNTDRQIEMF